MNLRSFVLATAGALSGVAATAHEAHDPAAAPPQAAAAAEASGDAAALRVVRDRDTGRLRAPTADELRAFDAERAAARVSSRAARGVPAQTVVRQYASGMRAAVLSPEHLSSLQATRRADGSLAIRHGAQAAAPAPTPLPTE